MRPLYREHLFGTLTGGSSAKQFIDQISKTELKKPNNLRFEQEEEEDKNIIPSKSIRDYFGKLAKFHTLLNNSSTSVSPILPVELSLTIYGNNYLNVGDLFTINFLPDFYLENIMFQITNVEHKVQSNWETTYSTVMRLRPDRKNKVTDVGDPS